MQACLDVVLPYVRERKQFGKPIGQFQLMQAKVADMYVALNSARAYVYAVARSCDAGRDDALRRGRRDPAGERECGEDVAGGDPGAGRRGLYQGVAGRALPARRQALRHRRRHQRDPPLPDRARADRRDDDARLASSTRRATPSPPTPRTTARWPQELRGPRPRPPRSAARRRTRERHVARGKLLPRDRVQRPARPRLALPRGRRAGGERHVRHRPTRARPAPASSPASAACRAANA